MRSCCKKIILLLICLLPLAMHAQDQSSTKDKAPATSRVQRKAAKKKWKEQRRAEMEDKKNVKNYHKRLQTKQTRRRMKKEKKKSDKLRANKRDPFFVRWFRRS